MMCPIVASGEKPKALFPLTEIMPFKFEYNLNIDHMLCVIIWILIIQSCFWQGKKVLFYITIKTF